MPKPKKMTEARALKLLEQLPTIDGVKPHGFVRSGENNLTVSGEHGDGLVDYYGPKGYPFIHPKLEAWATKKGMFWEWENAGCINLWYI